MLDSDIAVLGPPERLEPLPKRNNAGQHFRIILDVWMEERDATHARGLLRVHERPHRRAAKRDNEFSSSEADCGLKEQPRAQQRSGRNTLRN
jgi:hypothetical protein